VVGSLGDLVVYHEVAERREIRRRDGDHVRGLARAHIPLCCKTIRRVARQQGDESQDNKAMAPVSIH